MYCELCGVTVASRDVMENHKQVKYQEIIIFFKFSFKVPA